MTLPRQKFREMLFQLLFAKDFSLEKEKLSVSVMMKFLKTTRAQVAEAEKTAEAILEKKDFLDALIKKASEEYRLERITKIELNILRLALFELFFTPEIPKKVTMVEAMRLNGKFGSEKGAQFVNAILDRVYQEHHNELEKSDCLHELAVAKE